MNNQKIKWIASVAAILVLSAGILLPRTREAAADNPPLHVIASAGVQSALTEILPKAEHSMGRQITAEYGASKSLKEKILAGEAFDVAVLTAGEVDTLIQQGKIESKSRVDIARTGVGIGVRAGTTADVSTPDALKQTLLNSKSILLNPNGASTAYLNKALVELGIADRITPKFFPETDLDRFSDDVASGKVDLLVALMSEITTLKGVKLAGPLPGNLQTYVVFAAGAATNGKNGEASSALINFIASPSNDRLLKAKGLALH